MTPAASATSFIEVSWKPLIGERLERGLEQLLAAFGGGQAGGGRAVGGVGHPCSCTITDRATVPAFMSSKASLTWLVVDLLGDQFLELEVAVAPELEQLRARLGRRWTSRTSSP